MAKSDTVKPGPTCLGVVKHPACGIRIPELFLPGIIKAYRERNVAGELMLSFGRETAPEKVIRAPAGTWEITRGHTGTSIKQYMTAGATAAKEAGVTVEIEADHLIVIGSSTAAVQRIAGYHAESRISREQLRKSLEYNKMAIDEAAGVGVVGCFTMDTSDLFWLEADQLTEEQVDELFAERIPSDEADELLARYGQESTFPSPGGPQVTVTISNLQAKRLALKFRDSLRINAQIYRYCEQKLDKQPFTFEISLDETAEMTSPRETLFYLTEWHARGLPCHYFAPNIGFAKRADFEGDMAALECRVRQHHAIAQGVCGALLSIHSGSGSTPYSGKGEGTYEAIIAETGGDVKYKISGVYFELLMEMLSTLPTDSEGCRLYEQIFDAVWEFLNEELKQNGPLVQPLLIDQLERYEDQVNVDPDFRYNPRADFFRFNSYLALNMREESSKRYLRDALVGYVKGDEIFQAQFDQEVAALTLRLIDGLQMANNLG